ncbi:MAG: hypothetical protein IJP28_06420, partial [Erysipelotrichales bacterium]|nr:hypothetical protein [Erysipelotrichales bacterium]
MLDELNIDETSKNSLIEFVETMDIEVAEEVVKPLENNIAQDFEIPLDEDILKELHIESIQAEAGNAEGEAFMQQQTAQEHVVKAMINQEVETFDIKIEKTMDAQPVQTAPTKVADANPSKILNQIVKQMEGMQNGSKVNIVLNPESLGKVNVQLLST